jgi:hypothetical protein
MSGTIRISDEIGWSVKTSIFQEIFQTLLNELEQNDSDLSIKISKELYAEGLDYLNLTSLSANEMSVVLQSLESGYENSLRNGQLGRIQKEWFGWTMLYFSVLRALVKSDYRIRKQESKETSFELSIDAKNIWKASDIVGILIVEILSLPLASPDETGKSFLLTTRSDRQVRTLRLAKNHELCAIFERLKFFQEWCHKGGIGTTGDHSLLEEVRSSCTDLLQHMRKNYRVKACDNSSTEH